MSRALRLLLVAVGFVIAGVITASPASAHALLTGSSPTNSETLANAPTQVVFSFSENVTLDLGYVKMVDAKGASITTSKPSHPQGDGSKVAVTLPTDLADGGYIASYRVVSADSHPIVGAISFAVGAAAPPQIGSSGALTNATDTDPWVSALYPVVRWVGYLGLAGLIGSMAFAGFIYPPIRRSARLRRFTWIAFDAAIISTVLGALFQGIYGAGRPLSGLLDGNLISATLETNLGRMYALRLVVLGFAGVTIWEWLSAAAVSRWVTYAASTMLVGLTLAIAGGGHAPIGSWGFLGLISDSLHLVAMGVWIGGLGVILACLTRDTEGAKLTAAMQRFSQIALWCVVIIIVTGTFQAWREVGTLAALFSTTYGWLVVAKVSGLIVLVALAYFSRTWVQRRSFDPPPVATLRRTVTMEAAVALVVIGLAAVLVSEPPAKEVYVAAASVSSSFTNGDRAAVTVTPARAGTNSVQVKITGKGSVPFDPQLVEATANQGAAKIGPFPVALKKTGPGLYTASQNLPVKGKWTLTLTITMSEFDKYVTTVTVQVA